MEQTGKVIETNGGKAEVKVVRGTACGESCGNCHVCENRDNIRWMINDAKAQKGDIVLVEMRTKKVILMAFVAYIVPIIAGAVCYSVLSALVGKGIITDLVSFAFIVLTVLFVAKYNTFSKDKYQSHVTKILKKEADNEQN